MIAKIMKGSDFKGVVYYILNDEKGTQIIDADGLFPVSYTHLTLPTKA